MCLVNLICDRTWVHAFIYLLACLRENTDTDHILVWFRLQNLSSLCSHYFIYFFFFFVKCVYICKCVVLLYIKAQIDISLSIVSCIHYNFHRKMWESLVIGHL